MRFPKPIKKGDTIAIAAPSFGATTEPYASRLKEAIRRFKDRGYNVVIGECCFKSDGLGISTDPKAAAAELQNFYLDPKISAVFSCGGGELMCETISHLDFEKIKNAEPKWFLGYSDNTNFIFPLVTLCSVPALYGPNAPGFGKPWEQPENDTFRLLEGAGFTVEGYPMFQNPDVQSDDPLSAYIFTDKKKLVCYVPTEGKIKNKPETKSEAGLNRGFAVDFAGKTLKKLSAGENLKIEGTLLGGCLDCLVGLSGTRFDGVESFNREHKKVVWVLESCDYNPMDIRRALWHLKESGWFKNAAGFVFGRPLAAFKREVFGVNQYNAVTDVLGELGVPVVLDADFGHIDPAMPLVIGADAEVLVKDNDIKIKMNGISKSCNF